MPNQPAPTVRDARNVSAESISDLYNSLVVESVRSWFPIPIPKLPASSGLSDSFRAALLLSNDHQDILKLYMPRTLTHLLCQTARVNGWVHETQICIPGKLGPHWLTDSFKGVQTEAFIR